jgi:hypothetical protein
MLWFLAALGLLVAGFAIRDLLRQPDPTLLPDPLRPGPRGRDHTDWARAWVGPDGAGQGDSSGGGRP